MTNDWIIGAVCLLALCRCSQAPSSESASGLALSLLSSDSIQWDSISTAAVTSYAPAGTASDHAARLHRQSEDALHHALQVLQAGAYPKHLRVFFVRSRDTMSDLVGSPVAGINEASSGTVILVENGSWEPFARHEVMHAVSLHLWADPGGLTNTGSPQWQLGGWLREGLAAFAEDRCGGFPNRAIAAAYLDRGELIPLRGLVSNFYEYPDLASYLQAGSLVEFVFEAYGHQAFRRLWDTMSFEDALQTSLSHVENEWQSWLQRDTASRPNIDDLANHGC